MYAARIGVFLYDAHDPTLSAQNAERMGHPIFSIYGLDKEKEVEAPY